MDGQPKGEMETYGDRQRRCASPVLVKDSSGIGMEKIAALFFANRNYWSYTT